MNSVAPRVHNLDNSHKEGTGPKTVVLFSCTLFLIYQVYSLFFFSHQTSSLDKYLNVLPEHSLSIESFGSLNSSLNSKQSFSFDSEGICHLSPFFFKPVSINYSDISLLMSVKGIGPSLAKRILQERNSKGEFQDPQELLGIKGIGPAKLALIQPYLSFSKDHDLN